MKAGDRMQLSKVWDRIIQEEVLDIVVEKDADTRKAYMDTTRKVLRIIEDSKTLKEAEFKTLKRIRNKVNDIWINYLYGRVNTASSQMQNLIHTKIDDGTYIDLFKQRSELNQILYRGRISKNLLTQESDFYHIPFDQRYLIGNQRFSLSGIPCLYVASSKECVYAELGTTQDVQLCQMNLNHKVSLFDLTIQKQGYSSRQEQLLAFYKLSLQYACSIRALDNEGATFKTNYIIPQLVTATLYNMNEGIQGICYVSLKANTLLDEDRKNYVFLPEYRLGKTKYDMDLMSGFTIQLLSMK